MFQFRRFPAYTYLIQYTLTEYCSAGFPHSEIPGSKLICSSPRLIAAYHVLHRLLMPRHSPCALLHLTSKCIQDTVGSQNYVQTHKRLFLAKIVFYPYLYPLLLPSHNCIIHFCVQFSRCIPPAFETRFQYTGFCQRTEIYPQSREFGRICITPKQESRWWR